MFITSAAVDQLIKSHGVNITDEESIYALFVDYANRGITEVETINALRLGVEFFRKTFSKIDMVFRDSGTIIFYKENEHPIALSARRIDNENVLVSYRRALLF